MKYWLEKNDIKMHSTHKKRKSVIAERVIRTLKDKINKYITSVWKNVYIDKLDDIVNECNNTYHRAIKIKPVNVKPSTYINSSKETNEKDSKFKIDDIVRISKYKNIFVGEEIIETFYEKVLHKKQIKKGLELNK